MVTRPPDQINCPVCTRALPAGPVGFLGRCPACGTQYRVSRAGGSLLAILHEEAPTKPAGGPLALWIPFWISMIPAAWIVSQGRPGSEYTEFQLLSLYLEVGWIVTFAYFLTARARSRMGFMEARHRPLLIAFVFASVRC